MPDVSHGPLLQRSCVLPRVAAVAAAFILLALAGCGGGGGGGPVATVDPAMNAAQALFASRGCAACHGVAGEGDGSNPRTTLAGTRFIYTQFAQRVRNGKGSAMPAFGPEQISDAEVRALYDWLRMLPQP